MSWEQICNEGYRIFWRALILTSIFVIALVTTCTAGNAALSSEWERSQRAACNAAGGQWTYPVGYTSDAGCLHIEVK